MTTHGKRYAQTVQSLDRDRLHTVEEAVKLVKSTGTAKFNETVEVHFLTGADPKQADQLIRGVTVLPHGLGKQTRVLVFAGGEDAQIAKEAGADYVGLEDLITKIEGGWVDFDVSLAVPDVMAQIAKLGRVLGRRGLMPNPRTGTMAQAQDLPRIIEEAKKGRLEYRMDRNGIIHSTIGKADFNETQLFENLVSLVDAIVRSRPSGIKGSLFKTTYICTTMGPSINIDPSSLLDLKVDA